MKMMTDPITPDRALLHGSTEGRPAVPAVGRSVDEELERLQERHYQAVVPTILVVLLALFEWFRWWYPSQGEPLIFSLFALVAAGYTGWHLLASRRTLRSLRLARDEEWRMGLVLARLREQGFRVFHEVPGPEGPVDHVLIGPPGLFVLHQPALRPAAPEARGVAYSGADLRLDTDGATSQPLVLAKAQATWLRELVARQRPVPVAVRPIVVCPGWRIQSSVPVAQQEVWVLNDHSLSVVLSQEPVRLDPDAVQDLAAALGNYLKS